MTVRAVRNIVRRAYAIPYRCEDAGGGEDVVTTANGEFYLHVRTYLEDGPLEVNRQQSAADQDFIAHARADVPRLITEIRRLRALLPRRPDRPAST